MVNYRKSEHTYSWVRVVKAVQPKYWGLDLRVSTLHTLRINTALGWALGTLRINTPLRPRLVRDSQTLAWRLDLA